MLPASLWILGQRYQAVLGLAAAIKVVPRPIARFWAVNPCCELMGIGFWLFHSRIALMEPDVRGVLAWTISLLEGPGPKRQVPC